MAAEGSRACPDSSISDCKLTLNCSLSKIVSRLDDKCLMQEDQELNGTISDKGRNNKSGSSDGLGHLDALVETEDGGGDISLQLSQTSMITAKEETAQESFSVCGQEYLNTLIESDKESVDKIDDKSPEVAAKEGAYQGSISTGVSGPSLRIAQIRYEEESDDKSPEVPQASLTHESPSFTVDDLWKSRHSLLDINKNDSKILQVGDKMIESTDSAEIKEKRSQELVESFMPLSCFMESMNFSSATIHFFLDEEETDEEIWIENPPLSDDTKINFSILGTPADDISGRGYVLNPTLMDALRPHFPFAVQDNNFWLKYSMGEHVSFGHRCAHKKSSHNIIVELILAPQLFKSLYLEQGASMNTFLSKASNSLYTLLALETLQGEVFGSFTSSPWCHKGNIYYGSGESFLWRLCVGSRCTPCKTMQDLLERESDIEVFSWTGENRNIQLSNRKELIVGGGESDDDIRDGIEAEMKQTDGEENKEHDFGLMLNSDLSRGISGMCLTFDSPGLSKLGFDFEISKVELWALTPMMNVEEATKLEKRQSFAYKCAMQSCKNE